MPMVALGGWMESEPESSTLSLSRRSSFSAPENTENMETGKVGENQQITYRLWKGYWVSGGSTATSWLYVSLALRKWTFLSLSGSQRLGR